MQSSRNQSVIKSLNHCLVFTGCTNYWSLDHYWWNKHRCHASRGRGCARSHSHVTWCSTEGQCSTGSFDWHSDLGNSGSQKNSRRKSGKYIRNNCSSTWKMFDISMISIYANHWEKSGKVLVTNGFFLNWKSIEWHTLAFCVLFLTGSGAIPNDLQHAVTRRMPG